MARRKTTTPPVDVTEIVRFPHIAAPAAEYGAADDKRDAELEEILEQIGSDSKIVVYHVIEGKAQPTYAGPMPVEGFSLEGVLETYGGGDKALTIYQAGKKVGTWRVSLDPSVPATSPRAKMAARITGSGVAPANDMNNIITTMLSMQASNADMMQKTMIGIMGAVTTMLTAQRPQGSDVDTFVKMAEILKSNNNGPAPATSELFAVFKEGIAIASRLNEGGDDGTLGVVREGLAVVGKIVENNARPALPVAPVPRSLPRTPEAPVVEAPSPEPVSTVADRPWIAAIRPAAPLLFSMVGAFRPATAAQAIADRLDESQFEDLLNDVEAGTDADFVGRLGATFGFDVASLPETQRAWLLELVKELKALVEPETETTEEPAT
jgi:hypothetical protein